MSKRSTRRAARGAGKPKTQPSAPPVQRRDEPPPATPEPVPGPWWRSRFAVALLLILVLALALRTIRLSDVPHGFFCDEADIAMDAYSLGHTLRDKGGEGALLPFFLEGEGQFRGAFHTYCAVPFILLLGMNEFAVRFVAAVSGTLTVLLTGLFVSKAINRTVGLLSAFLLAVSPWHLMHSRAGWDVISLPLLIALFLTCFYYGLERPRWLVAACAAAALGMYGYFAGRLFIPLFCVACLFIYATPLWQRRRHMAAGFVVAAIILIPTFLSIKNGTFFNRINELSDANKTLEQILDTFKENYLLHFKPEFLLNTTTDPIHRHCVPGWGMIYWAEVPFLVLGVLLMIGRSFTPWRQRRDLLFLTWFAFFPLACALVSAPISTRAISGAIVFQIAIAEGIYACMIAVRWLLEKLPPLRPASRNVSLAVGAAAVLAVSATTAQYMQFYLNEYPKTSSDFWGWQWGARPMLEYFKAHANEYDMMFMSTEFNAPDQLRKFYTWPDAMGQGPCAKCSLSDAWLWWIDQNSRDNALAITYNPNLRTLWAVSPQALELMHKKAMRLHIVDQLTYPGGQPAFYFVATGQGG